VAVVDPDVLEVERAAREAVGDGFDAVSARGAALGRDDLVALLDTALLDTALGDTALGDTAP
jgi:hypothetical protein